MKVPFNNRLKSTNVLKDDRFDKVDDDDDEIFEIEDNLNEEADHE